MSKLDCLLFQLHCDLLNHRGGNIGYFLPQWKSLTGDKFIIDIIMHGLRLSFSKIPSLSSSREYPRPPSEIVAIDNEVSKLSSMQVIVPSTHEPGENFANLFTVPKSDSSRRTILNLKKLNTSCSTSHFKMDTIYSALKLVSKNCFFASVDLKDAFFSVD